MLLEIKWEHFYDYNGAYALVYLQNNLHNSIFNKNANQEWTQTTDWYEQYNRLLFTLGKFIG